MAPIPRIAAKPLSIITGALISAFSAPNSSPPSNGLNATAWGTEYTGSASSLNLTLRVSPLSSTPSSSSSSSSLVYYDTKTNTYTGCNKKTFSPTDNVAFLNTLQFGNIESSNSTCGEWILVQNRENTMQSTYAQIVGVCDDCEYGSVELSMSALDELAPDVPFENILFDRQSNNTINDLLVSDPPLPMESTPISPKNLVNIIWSLSSPPLETSGKPPGPGNINPTRIPTSPSTTTSTTSTTTTTTTSTTSAPTPTSAPSLEFAGRATWYSDTTGLCEQKYSQSDMIVAVNESQMGSDKKLCGKKILLFQKGSDIQVEVTVVDMCPGSHCKFGDLDLSQAAFKKFAGLGVGVLQLQWSFV